MQIPLVRDQRSRPGGSDISTLSAFNNEFLIHGVEDGDEALLLSVIENFLDVGGNFLQMLNIGEVDVRLDFSLGGEQLKGFVVDVQQVVLLSLYDGGVDHITGVVGALEHFGGEDIFSLENNLGGTMLSWLRSGHFCDLARVSLNHDKRSWLESIGISFFKHGCTGIGNFKCRLNGSPVQPRCMQDCLRMVALIIGARNGLGSRMGPKHKGHRLSRSRLA